MTPEEARAQFPVLERFAYLNAGTNGPLARATVEAIAARQRSDMANGRGGGPYFEEMLAVRERVRERFAQVLGVETTKLALTSSTTHACQLVLAGLGLGARDEVVTTDVEHFGLIGPLHASGARVRVARVRERPAADAFDAIRAEVGRRTRLLALSHVSWMTGHALPVRELKDETGLPVLVDGAQSVGAIPVAAGEFDFYAVSGQKWLCGPDGTGALAVAEPERLRVAAPTYFAQAGYEPDGTFTPRPGAMRFDATWLAPPLLAGLETALELAPSWRFERAAELTARCRALLAEQVDVVTEPGHATLISFRVGGDTAETTKRLHERGVVVRDVPGLGWIRVSCGYWTSEDDLARLLAALTD